MSGFDEDGAANKPARPPLPPFAFGGLGAASLKKAPEKIRFVSKDLSLSDDRTWKSSPTARMRFIDELRMYSPTPEDCSDLNIPEDRLNLHLLQDILFLCGGCAGARFSGDDFKLFRHLGSSLDPLYNQVDKLFKDLPAALKSRKLLGPYAASSSADAAAGGAAAAAVIAEAETAPDHHPEDAEVVELINFHKLADEYTRMLSDLQEVVRVKQDEVKRDSEHKEKIHFDGDPDGLSAGKALPGWLTTLISKYTSKVPPTGPQVYTIGKLSAFVSVVVVDRLACLPEEIDAINELVEASSDVFAHPAVEGSSGDSRHSHRYWSKRFYDFLSKLPELRAAVKDEKSVYDFEAFKAL